MPNEISTLSNDIMPINQIGRRILDEEGITPPPYHRIRTWAYDCKFRTVRVGGRSVVAESDWPEVKAAVLRLAQAR